VLHGVLQCVAVCCSVLQCVAVCCSGINVLYCVGKKMCAAKKTASIRMGGVRV